MEEFNLEKYNTGNYDVVTRDGRSVRIICTDAKRKSPIVALISSCIDKETIESVYSYTTNGKFFRDEISSQDILLKKKKWKPEYGDIYYYINENISVCSGIYSPNFRNRQRYDNKNAFKTKEEAIEAKKKIRKILRDE